MGTCDKQLSITEHRKIERWRHAKVPVYEMARVLKRCRSTIFRELRRNHLVIPPLKLLVFKSRIFSARYLRRFWMKNGRFSDAQIMHCPAGDCAAICREWYFEASGERCACL